MTNRLQKAAGVFEIWSSILCDTTLDLSKTNSLLQSVGALQPRMAKRLLDPNQNAGVSFGLLECSAPRACSDYEEDQRKTLVPSERKYRE